MIRKIEALNYRCLRYVSQRLNDFQVLVGPNGSGKTTFLDVVAFLGDLVSEGIEYAIEQRSESRAGRDIGWQRSAEWFELAIDAVIPTERQHSLKGDDAGICYEVRIGLAEGGQILEENVFLKHEKTDLARPASKRSDAFPRRRRAPGSILNRKAKANWRAVVSKVPGGKDCFYDETNGTCVEFNLGPYKSALANLPDDESKYPAATWLRGILKQGVFRIALNSMLMRKPSPRGKGNGLLPDGSNLAWIVDGLERAHVKERRQGWERFQSWIRHLQTALPDLETISTIERPEDGHRYIVVFHRNDLKLPSWMISDGTLRLLALTLPAYLPGFQGIYLIEEPENGIHPRAVETMFQSLSSVYRAQVLMATHSPVILSLAKPSQVLCFSKTNSGATDIVLGSEHPGLRAWKGATDLGTLFAAGVLG